MEEKTVLITAISCGHCAATIKSELGDIEGVAAVEVDVATRMAHIRFSAPADWPKIRETLEDIGYPPAE